MDYLVLYLTQPYKVGSDYLAHFLGNEYEALKK